MAASLLGVRAGSMCGIRKRWPDASRTSRAGVRAAPRLRGVGVAYDVDQLPFCHRDDQDVKLLPIPAAQEAWVLTHRGKRLLKEVGGGPQATSRPRQPPIDERPKRGLVPCEPSA